MSNIVAIVGRPNVGKSTLFNRLIGQKKAIIDDISGVTRDRVYGRCTWNGKTFNVVDTGGFVSGSNDIFEKAIASQVKIAIDEADLIIFMVDTTTGITDLDDKVGDLLRKTSKKVILAVNKVDNHANMLEANEFWAMGFENTIFVSSVSGSGTGELLDLTTEFLVEKPDLNPELPKLAIIGQPNVGKSSFVNALLNEERNIVTDIAGTTRDSIHSVYKKFDKEFILIDTAGLRKKSKVHEDLEFYSVMRAIRAVEEADVCIIMINALDGISSQDMKIFQLSIRRNKGVVFLVNKWDLVKKETNTARDFENNLKKKLAPFNDIPILFISVLEKQRIFKAVELAIKVYENRTQKIATSKLNEVIQEAIERNQPPSVQGRLPKIKYITQLPLHYPAFAIFCNNPKYIKEPYSNYLENQIRKSFDFSGVPLTLFFRKK